MQINKNLANEFMKDKNFEIRLGNIFGATGGSFAGMVYDKNGLSPTLNTMQGGGRQPHIIEVNKVEK